MCGLLAEEGLVEVVGVECGRGERVLMGGERGEDCRSMERDPS